jgi:hypothetical protein
MKNFKKYYSRINTLIAEKPKKVVREKAANGLVPRPTVSTESESKPMTAEQQIAQYVAIIRKQKEELLNAKG